MCVLYFVIVQVEMYSWLFCPYLQHILYPTDTDGDTKNNI